jgi:hypothetical protein
LYTEANVALSGTHTHSGPGAYLQYVLYDITSLGFNDQSYNALVDGIVEVISVCPLFIYLIVITWFRVLIIANVINTFFYLWCGNVQMVGESKPLVCYALCMIHNVS